MRFSITMHSLSGVGNKILGDHCTSLDTRGDAHGGGVSSSLTARRSHGPCRPSSTNDTLHLTGVMYTFFPNKGNLEEFFHTLSAHLDHSSHEPHMYAGDFNA